MLRATVLGNVVVYRASKVFLYYKTMHVDVVFLGAYCYTFSSAHVRKEFPQTHGTGFDGIFRFSLTHNFGPGQKRHNIFWSTDLLKFPFIGCFINFQKLKNLAALSNRVRGVSRP